MLTAPSVAPAAVWRATFGAVALVSGVPLAALAVLAWDERLVRWWAPHAAAVAVGALLGAALFQLLPEAYARAGPGGGGARIPLLAAAGLAAFFALERLLHGTHDHHDEGHALGGGGRGGRTFVGPAVAGDALHNLVDGALVAATFLATCGRGY